MALTRIYLGSSLSLAMDPSLIYMHYENILYVRPESVSLSLWLNTHGTTPITSIL